jgi:hypothetical protein
MLPVTERVILQGSVVASKQELYLARSLDKLGWTYTYQAPFFGGWLQSGGFVIDFIVDTVPIPTATWVQGSYWHSGPQAERDNFNQYMLNARLHNAYRILEIEEDRLVDQDEADKTVIKEFGRNK